MLKHAAIACALVAFCLPAAAATSIVGTWAASKADCKKPDERTVIKSMSIESYFRCDFVKVKRTGNNVVWDGACYGPEGDRRPESGTDTAAMTAVLKNGKLSLSGLGLGQSGLIRCK
jgi:hypothetical protein